MIRRCAFALILLFGATPAFTQDGPLQIITYHDVVKKEAIGKDRDEMAVTTKALTEHFRWLREQGYQPVSIDQLAAANNGGAPLPEKPVLLTFDDGLQSVYTEVFPLLKLFNYPAVVSVVTGWVEGNVTVRYAGRERGDEHFLTWAQIREMQATDLVEIASHSHALHRGIVVNVEGNTQPAAVARFYENGDYESVEARRQRLLDDLRESVAIIAEKTGKKPRVIAWPYGAYNHIGVEVASEIGLTWSLTLDSNYGNPSDAKILHRHLLEDNPNIRDFSTTLLRTQDPPLIRAAQVDLDSVYDEDPLQQERNLDLMIERMARLNISHVFLQAYSDLDDDGAAEALYYPNRFLPMRADLFNRAAWQLKTRAEVTVYAWMPILSFSGPAVDPSWRVMHQTRDGIQPDSDLESRLSPFNTEARDFITGIYEDLASHAQFKGLHFHADGWLNQNEDAGDAALQAYRDRYGTDLNILTLQDRPEDAQRWAELKTTALLEFTDDLASLVRQYQPELRTSRNLFAPVVMGTDGADLFAQDYAQFLAHYDFVTVMAGRFIAQADNPANRRAFYRTLVEKARAQDPALGRTVFQLQTVDWTQQQPVPAVELKNTFRMLQTIGVRSLAYYPDNFRQNQPELELLRQGISVADEMKKRLEPGLPYQGISVAEGRLRGQP